MKLFRKCLMILSSIIITIQFGCKDKITNPNIFPPLSGSDYQICYCGYGQIKINNNLGTNPQNISLQDSSYQNGYYDDYPQWSPDGRYVVFQRLRPDTIYNPFVYVYDTQNKTYKNLTSDGGLASSNPQWTASGKVYFSYARPVSSAKATYMMDPDGANKMKILNSAASIYFFKDSYTFLYINGTEVFKTNIDSTNNELVFELPRPEATQYITIRDFNPVTGEFLVNTNMIADVASAIATLNPETKQLKMILSADPGFLVFLPQYSSDYSKIVFVEYGDTAGYYLSVFENGKKTRLVHPSHDTTGSYEELSWYVPKFSSDGKYIAFDELMYGSGQWINFLQYLYVVNVSTKNLQFVDKGFGVTWNPKQ